MKSIKNVYKIGSGPSSSHTMGPETAAKLFVKSFPNSDHVNCTLFGSLALTGKGHLTDYIINEVFDSAQIKCDIKFDYTTKVSHPNTMIFKTNEIIWTVRSIGGGEITIDERPSNSLDTELYSENNFSSIIAYCKKNEIDLYEYIDKYEDNIYSYLVDIWQVMKKSVRRGLEVEGNLPGELQVSRKARSLLEDADEQQLLICSYAYAVSEENAAGGQIVTAPTCGACGVLPSVLYDLYTNHNITEELIIKGLAVAALIGQIIINNASVSGAEAGCQAEIGSATAMTAAAISYINGESLRVIEASAEIGLEHQLGLTCDPVLGYVQIPCIQRNALGANKAIIASRLAKVISSTENIEFDVIVKVMYETGKDLMSEYRETSIGGLAKYYRKGVNYEK